VGAAEEYNPFATREKPTASTDRVIVKLRSSGAAVSPGKPSFQGGPVADRTARVSVRTSLKMSRLRDLGPGMQVVRVESAQPGESLDDMLNRLRADPEVEFAEPDARMYPHRVPNDPAVPEQWYLQDRTSTPNGATASAINAVGAWDLTIGAPSIVVAVIDSGVRFDHPDLRRVENGGKLLAGHDFVGTDAGGGTLAANDGDGWDRDPSDPGDWISSQDKQSPPFTACPVEDSSWHGTRVSGIVAALTDNAVGIAGVGWANRVLPVRVLGKCGGFTSDIIAGMRWAAGLNQSGAPANPNPARVLNLSLGGEGSCSSAYQSAIDEITARNVLVVVSAGNDGSLTDQPGNCRGVISVTGARHVGTKVGFANLGSDVTIAAPGGNCVNTGFGEPCLFSLDTTTNLGTRAPGENGYTDRTGDFNVGTSFAAPIVAGIAALMLSVNEQLSPDEVTERLRATATPFPASGDPSVPTCRVPTGSDDTQLAECVCTTATCGAGLANAAAATIAALRPMAVIAGPASVNGGETVTLTAGNSTAANNRSITGYQWSVVSGSTSLASLSGLQTSFVAPGTSGTVVVRLTVTDDEGRSDAVEKTVSVSGSAPPPPTPPATPPSPPPASGSGGGGGGGALDMLTLLFAGLLASLAWKKGNHVESRGDHRAGIRLCATCIRRREDPDREGRGSSALQLPDQGAARAGRPR
jgi:serine protease